jgi:hypothetical protein
MVNTHIRYTPPLLMVSPDLVLRPMWNMVMCTRSSVISPLPDRRLPGKEGGQPGLQSGDDQLGIAGIGVESVSHDTLTLRASALKALETCM